MCGRNIMFDTRKANRHVGWLCQPHDALNAADCHNATI
jgi:hypothetical protein